MLVDVDIRVPELLVLMPVISEHNFPKQRGAPEAVGACGGRWSRSVRRGSRGGRRGDRKGGVYGKGGDVVWRRGGGKKRSCSGGGTYRSSGGGRTREEVTGAPVELACLGGRSDGSWA